MIKMDNTNKKQIYGGVTPTLIWVALMGAVMVCQTICSIVDDIGAKYKPDNNGHSEAHKISKKSNTYARLSPMPLRSAVGM
jgi:hypothetical protein